MRTGDPRVACSLCRQMELRYAEHMKTFRSAALILLLLTGCQSLREKPAALPFHECYQEITDPDALEFVQQALDLLNEKYGGPSRPIHTIHLRLAERNQTGRAYRLAEHFSKTEWISPGTVAMYIEVPPGNKEFYPLLGHECGHLLDPSIVNDWQMEGFCMRFSEEICNRTGRSWTVWKRRFTRKSSDPYAKAYWKAIETDSKKY